MIYNRHIKLLFKYNLLGSMYITFINYRYKTLHKIKGLWHVFNNYRYKTLHKIKRLWQVLFIIYFLIYKFIFLFSSLIDYI